MRADHRLRALVFDVLVLIAFVAAVVGSGLVYRANYRECRAHGLSVRDCVVGRR